MLRRLNCEASPIGLTEVHDLLGKIVGRGAPTVANRSLAFIWAPATPWTSRWAIEGGNEVNVL
jgi:hypothetical protein